MAGHNAAGSPNCSVHMCYGGLPGQFRCLVSWLVGSGVAGPLGPGDGGVDPTN
jgi:hypothetical protein